MAKVILKCKVNGEPKELFIDDRDSLSDVLKKSTSSFKC